MMRGLQFWGGSFFRLDLLELPKLFGRIAPQFWERTVCSWLSVSVQTRASGLGQFFTAIAFFGVFSDHFKVNDFYHIKGHSVSLSQRTSPLSRLAVRVRNIDNGSLASFGERRILCRLTPGGACSIFVTGLHSWWWGQCQQHKLVTGEDENYTEDYFQCFMAMDCSHQEAVWCLYLWPPWSWLQQKKAELRNETSPHREHVGSRKSQEENSWIIRMSHIGAIPDSGEVVTSIAPLEKDAHGRRLKRMILAWSVCTSFRHAHIQCLDHVFDTCLW